MSKLHHRRSSLRQTTKYARCAIHQYGTIPFGVALYPVQTFNIRRNDCTISIRYNRIALFKCSNFTPILGYIMQEPRESEEEPTAPEDGPIEPDEEPDEGRVGDTNRPSHIQRNYLKKTSFLSSN
jgi:hypothetical protein